MLTSYFHVCKLWVLALKTNIWWNVCESARFMEQQFCARCFQTIHIQLNIDGIKCLIKKIDMTGSLSVTSCSTDSRQVVLRAVTQCTYTCQHQQSWGSHTQHIFGFSQHNDQLVCFNISSMTVFNGKTHNLQTRNYDVSMTSSVAKNI